MSKPASSHGHILTKAAVIASIPVIFFVGGNIGLLVFASTAIRQPVTAILTKAARQNILFTAAPPGEAVLGKSVARKEARPLILKKYLESYKSPLAERAQFLIDTADKYGLDWRLLPAIAGQESTFCRTIPENSHNCWGWAIHARYTKKFETWEGAIETVAKGLKEDYIDKGLITPEQIMTRYCPRSITERDGSWAIAINYFLWEMDRF